MRKGLHEPRPVLRTKQRPVSEQWGRSPSSARTRLGRLIMLVHCKNVWITSTHFWLPELHRTIDDLQLRCPNWVKVTQSFLQCSFPIPVYSCTPSIILIPAHYSRIMLNCFVKIYNYIVSKSQSTKYIYASEYGSVTRVH